MATPFFGRMRHRLRRILCRIFAVDPGPANLAEEVADRLLDKLTREERSLLRRRFGVDPETSASLEEIGALRLETRWRTREIEAAALIRLYSWEHRKRRSPAVQRRLIQRVAAAHDEILEALCDTPSLRPVLVDWHDRLVDGRCAAEEIAEPPAPATADDPDGDPQTPELTLAAKLRRALWANARARKPVRDADDVQAVRGAERAKALEALRLLRLNARSIDTAAETLLGHARRMKVESDRIGPQLLDPVDDPDASAAPDGEASSAEPLRMRVPEVSALPPGLVDIITAESGMAPPELRNRAGVVGSALAKARRNRLLLVDSCMPIVAGMAVAKRLRGHAFAACIEHGRAALLRLVDRFRFAGNMDFAAVSEETIRNALG